MTKNIKWRTLLGVLGGAWLLFAVAAAARWPIAALGFPLLVALPGWLLTKALGIQTKGLIRMVLYSVGLSIALLLGWGWLCNWLLPVVGVNEPLGLVPLQIQIHLLVAGLFGLAWRRAQDHADVQLALPGLSAREFAIVAAPVSLIAMAIAGAVTLNNGGSGAVTFVMLLGALVFTALLVVWRDVLRPGVIGWGLYGMGLSLLLMTSLRSWFIMGHDIQQEYYVFQLTKDAGLWSMAAFQDAYNACLSITILPTQFANMLHVAEGAVYKVLFPMLFALVPVAVYALVRRFSSRLVALLSSVYFMAVPTFFADLPFLNRQMIAFVFMALTLYALFDKRLSLTSRRVLAIVFGLSMVVSHYSTTYLLVGILAGALVLRWALVFAVNKRWTWVQRVFRNSAIAELRERQSAPAYALNVTVVGALLAGALIWSLTTWISNPGQLATNAWNKTVKCFTLNCQAPERSSDVGLSLLGIGSGPDYTAQLNDYRKDIVDPRHDRIPKSERYPNAAVDQNDITAVAPTPTPPSAFAEAINTVLPFNIVDVTDTFHSLMIRLVQVLVLIGAVAVLFWGRFGRRLPTEFTLIALVSIAVVIATVVVPGLSVRYGILRAFEQSLIVAGPLLVIGSFVALAWRPAYWQRVGAAAVALVFMATTTGVGHFMFGGGNPQLHLYNDGMYYNQYYVHQSELRAMDWLANKVKDPDTRGLVQMDRYQYAKWRSNTGNTHANNLLYPTLIRKGSYVLLGKNNVQNKTSAVFHNGTVVTYTYPVSFLDQQKNLIYSSNGARVYR